MNFSAEKSSRKWAIRALGRTAAALVTAALALWAARPVLEPALAREPRPAPPLELFSKKPPKLRGSLHPVAVPLPRPRPAEADDDKPVPDEAGKAAEPAKPEPSACRLALTDAIAIAPSI
jgi:hypothetical protein